MRVVLKTSRPLHSSGGVARAPAGLSSSRSLSGSLSELYKRTITMVTSCPRDSGLPERRRGGARSDGVQMGRYWEVEVKTDHDKGLVPVEAGCGVSGRRERAVRAGSANGRREWTARAGGASGRRKRVAKSGGVQMGRYWDAIGAISALGPLGVAGSRVHIINLAMTSNFARVIKVTPTRLG